MADRDTGILRCHEVHIAVAEGRQECSPERHLAARHMGLTIGSVSSARMSNLRRLFQCVTGITPSGYRSRFGIAARVDRQGGLSAGQAVRIRSTPSR